jgi:catechol 2,3-dioxygenase-like lactoylglutathione lyase family enzyme
MAVANSTSLSKMHVSLNVKDIERSVNFYEGFFGVPAHKRRPGYANFDIANPPLKLALQEAPVSEGLNPLSHLGILVDSEAEVQATRERLISSGLASFDERGRGRPFLCGRHGRRDGVLCAEPNCVYHLP